MPVILQKLTQAELAQHSVWQADAEKLWQEAYPEQLAEIQQQLGQPNTWLAAAIFNERLLGGVLVAEQADKWQLSFLAVRKTTRNRGVAKQLLHLVATQAASQGISDLPTLAELKPKFSYS